MNFIPINDDRLFDYIKQIAKIGATAKGGCNRQALTQLDKEARDIFINWCQCIGGVSRLDSMGNLFVRFSGQNNQLDPVILGSHLDTQPCGGKFDGVYGVLAALEVMHTLHDHGTTLLHPVDIVVWCNEEGARFAPAMVGSGVFAGAFAQNDIYKITDNEGQSFYQALVDSEQLGQLPCQKYPFKAAIELHIEQGPILESKNKSIGVVTGVQGMNWYQVTLTGQSVHAGPTPMSMRNDPVQALSLILPKLYSLISEFGENARLTVGRIQTYPSVANTVPERVEFTLDIRHPDQRQLDEISRTIHTLFDQQGSNIRIEIKPLWESPSIQFSQMCIDSIEKSCIEQSVEYLPIVSGAGHDSVYLSKVGPTGMIFVPCKDGISHNEAEHVEPKFLSAGANILLSTLQKVAN
ncbi:MAG: N-carbamoyl-L-amino-acid hydrolase [Psychromonas sp.]|jgi:N-carbamoyl-L-amino-acid hydrolase